MLSTRMARLVRSFPSRPGDNELLVHYIFVTRGPSWPRRRAMVQEGLLTIRPQDSAGSSQPGRSRNEVDEVLESKLSLKGSGHPRLCVLAGAILPPMTSVSATTCCAMNYRGLRGEQRSKATSL